MQADFVNVLFLDSSYFLLLFFNKFQTGVSVLHFFRLRHSILKERIRRDWISLLTSTLHGQKP